MPKAPITSRTIFFETLPNKTKRFLPFCAVETELGTMVEPFVFDGGGVGANIDVYDRSFNFIQEMTEAEFRKLYGCGGVQWPSDYSPQGA